MASLDVFEGALRIARAEYPALDVGACKAAVDTLAAEAQRRASGRGRRALEAFHELFFGRWGFTGNRDAYYDPRNSFVNDVLDRRTGIPISLAAVYGAIAGRLGIPIRGVAFPGHFLAKWTSGRSTAIIDCFHGRMLSREDCAELLREVAPAAPADRLDSYLEVTPPGRVLSRMLGNLRQIHGRLGDFRRVARWITLDLEFNPAEAELYRDRGLTWAKIEAYGPALEDLERYLAMSPGAPDAESVRRQAAPLRARLAQLN
jgi:regulator of sirC expression with transglutaminase-like and TPR domain